MHPDFLLEFLTFSDCKIQSQGLFVQPTLTHHRYRAVPNVVTIIHQLSHAKGVGPAHPPGARFLVPAQESGERKPPRGDAECHAPACQAALPWVPL